MNLSIIITGQIRSFFKNYKYFLEMYNLSKIKYENILIILVINDNYKSNEIENFFDSLNANYLIIDYNFYIDEFKYNFDKKIQDPKFLKLNNNYSDYWVLQAIKTGSRQFHQLNIGIKELLKYEKRNKICYNVVMRTRFDVLYNKNFYPHLSENNIYDKLLLDDITIKNFNYTCKKYNINSLNELITFLKEKKNQLPKLYYNIDEEFINISFGSNIFYNYVALENIINGSNDILYSYHDFYFFANRNIFLKLINLYDQSFIVDTDIVSNSFFCAESQLAIYCHNNSINILMYNYPRL